MNKITFENDETTTVFYVSEEEFNETYDKLFGSSK